MSDLNFSDQEIFSDDDSDLQDLNVEESNLFAQDSNAILHEHLNTKSFFIRQGGAINESQKEFELFDFYAKCGGGRSYNYISAIFNLQESRVAQIAKKNNWAQRVADYDRNEFANKLQLEKDARAIEHKRKLEEYRSQQEFLGRALSHDAAKLAQLANRTLDEYLNSDRALDMRDIPSILNSAAKVAEVAKSLQSNALGVDQLLIALEEADFDE
jgi:Mor family transcriptional regulator